MQNEPRSVRIFRNEAGDVVLTHPSIHVGEKPDEYVNPKVVNVITLNLMQNLSSLPEVIFAWMGTPTMHPTVDADQESLQGVKDFIEQEGLFSQTDVKVIIRALLQAVADGKLSIEYVRY